MNAPWWRKPGLEDVDPVWVDRLCNEIIAFSKLLPGSQYITAIGISGGFARRTANVGSDIDVYISFGDNLARAKRLAAQSPDQLQAAQDKLISTRIWCGLKHIDVAYRSDDEKTDPRKQVYDVIGRKWYGKRPGEICQTDYRTTRDGQQISRVKSGRIERGVDDWNPDGTYKGYA